MDVKADLVVSDIRAGCSPVAHQVRGAVGGETLWFESPDVELRPAPEAFGSALLVAALHNRRRLRIEAEVSAKWLTNVESLLEVLNGWWDYPKLKPLAAATHAFGGAPTSDRTALCFSGGVDAFYSLMASGLKVDLLVGVHGFDIPLREEGRAAAFESSLRAVAAEVGLPAVAVRTNLRVHGAFTRAPWERAHGGALAAVGHVLGGTASRLLISSSHPYSDSKPWGSHFQTDPLWSAEVTEVAHVGAELRRSAKLRAIAHEPLVRRHLRVCWENLAPEGNCSRCEKCLRTRLFLADCGELENFPVFEGPHTLVQRLDSLPAIRGRGRALLRLLERGRLTPEVAAAVRRLLRRNERSRTLRSRFTRRVRAWARNRLR